MVYLTVQTLELDALSEVLDCFELVQHYHYCTAIVIAGIGIY